MLDFNKERVALGTDLASFSTFLTFAFGSVCREDITTLVEFIGVKEGDVFIDLGSNLGQEVEPMAALGLEVHAFEPHPMLFSFLEKRHHDKKNVILHKAAASTTNGEANFYFKRDPLEPNGGASLVREKNSPAGSTPVKCLDIASYINSLQSRVRILKIDVEGSEYELLQKLIDEDVIDKIDYILFEDHSGGLYRPQWANKAINAIMCMKSRASTTKIILWEGSGQVHKDKFISLFATSVDVV